MAELSNRLNMDTDSLFVVLESIESFANNFDSDAESSDSEDIAVIFQVEPHIQRIQRTIPLLENEFLNFHTVDDRLIQESMNIIDERIMNVLLQESFIDDPIALNPVSDTVLEQLPIIELDDYKLKKYRQCTICLEDFVLGEKVINLTCNHFYHEPCIKQWFKNQNMCPICKKEVSFN